MWLPCLARIPGTRRWGRGWTNKRRREGIPGNLFTCAPSFLERTGRHQISTCFLHRSVTLGVGVIVVYWERWAFRFRFRVGTRVTPPRMRRRSRSNIYPLRLFTLRLSSPCARIVLRLRSSTPESPVSGEGDEIPVSEPTNEEPFFLVFDSWSDYGARPTESRIEQMTE